MLRTIQTKTKTAAEPEPEGTQEGTPNDGEEDEDVSSPTWAADAPAVRALMDARDVAWRDFTAACGDAYARHAAATARRVADEAAHRQLWNELVARAKQGR